MPGAGKPKALADPCDRIHDLSHQLLFPLYSVLGIRISSNGLFLSVSLPLRHYPSTMFPLPRHSCCIPVIPMPCSSANQSHSLPQKDEATTPDPRPELFASDAN